jgi:hypothetical protein
MLQDPEGVHEIEAGIPERKVTDVRLDRVKVRAAPEVFPAGFYGSGIIYGDDSRSKIESNLCEAARAAASIQDHRAAELLSSPA